MATARDELVRELEDLRTRVGTPSLRTIAAATGCSHTTVAKLLSPNQPLPSWARVAVIAEYLEGNLDHIRHMWVAARGEAGLDQTANAAVVTTADDSRRFLSYYVTLYVLFLGTIVAVTVGGAVSREAGWLLSVVVQTVSYLGAASIALMLRSRYRPDTRVPMVWFAASAGCNVVAETLQFLTPHLSSTAPLMIASDVLYLSARVLLVICLTVYLRNRSRVAIAPWVRLGFGWTPLVWLCAMLTCYLLMSGHISSFHRTDFVQLIVNAFYLTFDIQFLVLAAVVFAKYAPKRSPFFPMLLIGTFLLVSDVGWSFLGPTTPPTPFTTGVGYVAASALMIAIALNPDLRPVPVRGAVSTNPDARLAPN